MALSRSVCSFHFFILFKVLLIVSGDPPYGKPQILSKYDEDTIEANDNYEIFCQGNKPLKWTVPKVEGNESTWTIFKTMEEKPASSMFKYGLRLHIINITYPFVGFYYCHYKDIEKVDESNSASIYLFVHDEEHLTVEQFHSITVTQYEEAVLPCRPTFKDVVVTLENDTGDQVEGADYDPKSGFSVFVYDLSLEGSYFCTFTRNSVTVDVVVHLSVIMSSKVSHLDKPELIDLNSGHTEVGKTLSLRCQIRSPNSVHFEWSRSNGDLKIRNKEIVNIDDSRQDLYIKNAKVEDNDLYTCKVFDKQNHMNEASLMVKVFDVDEFYINISEPNDVRHVVTYVGKDNVQWVVDVKGHPKPDIKWLNNDNDTILLENGKKYYASYNETTNKALLRIKKIDMGDFGRYTLIAMNNRTMKQMDFFLNVTDKPFVQLKSPHFFSLGKKVTIYCDAAAHPPPEIYWEYKACQDETCEFIPIGGKLVAEEGLHFTSETSIVPNESGMIRCSASNFNGTDEETKKFFVTDVNEGFSVFVSDDETVRNSTHAIFAAGGTIPVVCGSSYRNYSDIIWLYNGDILAPSEKYIIVKSYTKFSNRSTLNIRFANVADSGRYSCRIENRDDYKEESIDIVITAPVKPVLLPTSNMKGGVAETEYPLPYDFICMVYGVPKPSITWYKNDIPFNPTEERILVEKDTQVLHFNRTNEKDEGTYKCKATNSVGEVAAEQKLKFKNIPRYFWLFVVIGCLALLFMIAVVFIIIKTKRETRLQKELKSLGLANFEKGAIENINPELGIDEQAELLPYDKKWEFPIERLKLGKQLGSGAFGVVLKGEAKNIVDGEPVTTVAVKMVKKNADNTYIKALASELKIMVHLGKHLNVVNLLGACTKNVARRELLVIVEYCRYGNLQNYLLRHRDNFINQIDPKTGKVDYTIGQEYDLDRCYSVSSNRSHCQSPCMKYAALTFSGNSGNTLMLPPQNSMGDYRSQPNSGASAGTEMTTLPQDEEVIVSNNSVQPEWRSNYKGDYKGSVKPICTKDLLAWSFQVARGMEYLSTRKILHGDLAARNILLSDNNIVKICDFGLAKNMYQSDNYKKRGDCPLPIKWMAIESIRDRVFSTQSDVWAFGIVLWELFSLARTPYPGMAADERLYHKLLEGYRMEAPEYAPNQVYQIMTECWLARPISRPTFGKLSERLGNLLEDTLRKHYVDLNDPYLAMNTRMIEEGQNDYLAMVSPPTFEAIATPHYQNDNISDKFEDQGYMSMKPNTIFSPRYDEGPVFDFNVNNRKRLPSEDCSGGQELLPMLRSQNESDCDTPLQSPTAVSNPIYHRLPVPGNIVRSADNYVSMLQNKQTMKKDDGTVNKEEPPQYVNNCTRDWEAVVV